jgi:hypothetical protein
MGRDIVLSSELPKVEDACDGLAVAVPQTASDVRTDRAHVKGTSRTNKGEDAGELLCLCWDGAVL